MDRRTFISLALLSAGSMITPPLVLADQKPLKLGIFPRRNVKLTYKLFTPMAQHLSQVLGRQVTFETTRTFEDFWENVKKSRYDIVHYNQYHYIVSHKLYHYDVIAANKELGSNLISGSIIVRKDSNINEIIDLKGKTVLFGGSNLAMQSYISATWLLRKGGLQPGDYIEKFAINPPNTIISTFFKRADASGAGGGVMKLDNVRQRIDITQLKFLAETEPMTHLPWAVSNHLPDDLKNKIRNTLINLDKNTAGIRVLNAANLDALVPVIDSDFDKHRKIIIDVFGDEYDKKL